MVRYDVHEGVATVTLDRPAKLNAMTPAMRTQLADRLAAADRHPEVRAIVLTGAGRGFCAGADLGVLGTLGEGASELERRAADDEGPLRLSTPLIAAVNGPTAGMGFSWMLAADVRYAAEGARMSATFPRLGLVAEWGSAWTLTRLVGTGHAADLLLSGRTVDAAEALAMGLVQRVLPPAELLPAATAWARDVAAGCSPRSTAVIKAQLEAAATQDLDTAYAESVALMVDSFTWPDLPVALAARSAGQPPHFPSYVPPTEGPQ